MSREWKRAARIRLGLTFSGTRPFETRYAFSCASIEDSIAGSALDESVA